MTDTDCCCLPTAQSSTAKRPSCLLCNRPAKVTVLFMPSDDSPMAPAARKQRVIIYTLCECCHRLRHSLTPLIESVIETDMRKVGMI